MEDLVTVYRKTVGPLRERLIKIDEETKELLSPAANRVSEAKINILKMHVEEAYSREDFPEVEKLKREEEALTAAAADKASEIERRRKALVEETEEIKKKISLTYWEIIETHFPVSKAKPFEWEDRLLRFGDRIDELRGLLPSVAKGLMMEKELTTLQDLLNLRDEVRALSSARADFIRSETLRELIASQSWN